MTYYNPGLGACGLTSSASENICAISHVLYDAHNVNGNPNDNPLCGHRIRATRFDEGRGEVRSLVLVVVDRCEWLGFLLFFGGGGFFLLPPIDPPPFFFLFKREEVSGNLAPTRNIS